MHRFFLLPKSYHICAHLILPRSMKGLQTFLQKAVHRTNQAHFCFRAIVLAILFRNALPLDIYTSFLHFIKFSTKMSPPLRKIPLPLQKSPPYTHSPTPTFTVLLLSPPQLLLKQGLFLSFFPHLEPCLAQNKASISIYWMNEWLQQGTEKTDDLHTVAHN